MSLRVISGSAKGCRLKQVPGDTTRPIMDRVKEALFNILGRDIVGSQFLDLFSGTGSVGIEALSRGAKQAVFVETERRAIETIQENLTLTRLQDRAIIRRIDVFEFLKHPLAEKCGFIYIAPPQYKNLWVETLHTIEAYPDWLGSETQVIVQIDPSEEKTARLSLSYLEEQDRRRYGRTLLLFYRRGDNQTDNLGEGTA